MKSPFADPHAILFVGLGALAVLSACGQEPRSAPTDGEAVKQRAIEAPRLISSKRPSLAASASDPIWRKPVACPVSFSSVA